MNFNDALKILQLAISILQSHLKGGVQSDAALAGTLSQIVQVAAQAHLDQTGQPIDPSLIRAEAGI